MSLNDIQLTPSLIADLYNDKLVEQKQNQTHKAKPGFLGKNEKKILIASIDQDAVYMSDKQLAFLTNVLDACKLSLADVAIVNWQSVDEEARSSAINSLGAQTILLFGIEPEAIGLPVHFPAFQVQDFNKKTYLHAPLLAEIESDKDLKKQLWSSLKRIFAI
jgi:hypothetical protein